MANFQLRDVGLIALEHQKRNDAKVGRPTIAIEQEEQKSVDVVPLISLVILKTEPGTEIGKIGHVLVDVPSVARRLPGPQSYGHV